MAKFRSGVHTKVETLIERSGGYDSNYHLSKLMEYGLSHNDIMTIISYEKDYDKQIIIIEAINEGKITIEDIKELKELKKKCFKELGCLMGIMGSMSNAKYLDILNIFKG